MQLHSPDMCILLETHLSGQGLANAKQRFPSSWSMYAIESQGMARVVIVVWRWCRATVDIFHKYTQVYIVISEMNGLTWLLSGGYASTVIKNVGPCEMRYAFY